MLRIRSLLPASVLLVTAAAVIFVAPVGSSSSWTAVSAQAAPKTALGDRLFLKLDGIDGEATETDHSGELAVQSFSWSESRTADTSVRPQVKDFHIVMRADKAAPILMKKSATRGIIGKAVLSVRNSLGQDYMKWTIGDAYVSSFQIEETTGQTKPQVTFDLAVSRIDVEYRPQLFTGGLGPAVKAGWDAKGG